MLTLLMKKYVYIVKFLSTSICLLVHVYFDIFGSRAANSFVLNSLLYQDFDMYRHIQSVYCFVLLTVVFSKVIF